MANYLERATVRSDAELNPFQVGFAPPTDAAGNERARADIVGAVNFRRRLQSAMEDIAYDIIQAAGGETPPTANDLLWAQQVSNREIHPSTTALQLVLAHFDSTSPAQFAGISDEQMKDFLITVVPILTEGIRRR